MSRAQTPAAARVDLDALGGGPSTPVACGFCDTPTRSHTLVDTGEQWVELDGSETVAHLDAGTTVTFAVVCHGCFETYPLPARGDTRDVLTAMLDGDAVFQGVVG